MYSSWCFRSWPPEEPLPSRTRRAHVAIAARSMVRPASMTVSTALTMAANPHSAATTRMSSSHTRTDARKPSADGIGTIGSRPAKADRVLHAALPVAGIRVAEPGFGPVVRAEQGEQTGPGGRAVGVAVAYADGVVEHHDPGRHAHPLEHLRQTSAHAFRGLARQRRHPAHVRTRERHRRETHDPLHVSDHGPGPAEIDLRASRRPLRFGEAVRPRSMPRLQRLTRRCTDEYGPVNPHSPTSRSYTRAAARRRLTGMRRPAAGHPSTTAAYPSSTSDPPARAPSDDSGE